MAYKNKQDLDGMMREFEKTQRALTGTSSTIVFSFAVIAALFHLAVLTVRPIDPWLLRSWHLFFMGALIFLLYKATPSSPEHKPSWSDWVLAGVSIIPPVYIMLNLEPLLMRYSVRPLPLDIIVATLILVLALEVTRRSNGWPLPIISIIFILYAVFGRQLPGFLWNRGYDWDRLVATLMTPDGIYYIPLGVSASYVIMFLLFGAFLKVSGAGEFFINLAFSVAGKTRGGPAKVAVFASSLMGTVSGSAVGNTVATGSFTIPLMKQVGYKPYFAAAVEAVASTGGQIMPPVMGAAAFIMADILGIPYAHLVIAAIVPAILYYVAVFAAVDLEAVKLGLKGLPKNELPDSKKIMKEGFYYFLPLIVVIVSLVGLNHSPIKAGLLGSIACVVCSWFSKSNRMGIRKILQALADGAKDTANIAATCACAGIVIGIMGLTGLGGKLGNLIVNIGMTNLFLALILTMVLSLVLGMGLPTVAAYAIAGSTVGPALTKLGFDPLVAHMFIFYFACISTITPPVALSAYAGAAIAGANPLRVGVTAVKLGIVAFIVPFMFVYNPQLLMIGKWYNILLAAITAFIGAMAMAAGLQGFVFRRTSLFERCLLIIGALTLIKPGLLTDFIGFALLSVAIITNYRAYKVDLVAAKAVKNA